MQTGELSLDIQLEGEKKLIEDAIQELLRTKKQMRMYPSNNPVHINASKKLYKKFTESIASTGSITITINMNSFFYKGEQVYHSPEKEDNLAFFFFKDGVKELTFQNGIEQEELEDFVRLLNMDFENDAPDDDIVTLLWEADFCHITYFADDNFLGNWEIEYDNRISDDAVKSAYRDAQNSQYEKRDIKIRLAEGDFRYFNTEINRQSNTKLKKIITFLFELLGSSGDSEYVREVIGIIVSLIDYCVTRADYRTASNILDLVRDVSESSSVSGTCLKHMKNINYAINGKTFIQKIGDTLCRPSDINRRNFTSFIEHLDASSIIYFKNLLGELNTIKGRQLIIEALVILGQKNKMSIVKGLNDSRWFVVRNIALILGKIADPGTLRYLKKALSHSDYRVRKEIVRAIGCIASHDSAIIISGALKDEYKSVRITAARVLGNMRTEDAKKYLLTELSDRRFVSKNYSEKREFFLIITHWQDRDVIKFLMETLNKKRFLNKTRYDESRACAAYALGLMKVKESAALLRKAGKSKNKLLRETSLDALNCLNK